MNLPGPVKRTMRQLTIVTALALVFACSTRIERTQVIEAERARADAIARRDAAAYGNLVAPDLIVVDSNGDVRDKDARMEAVSSGAASNTKRVEDDVDVRVFGDLALVMGRADSQEKGELNRDYFLRVWAQQNGVLKVVASHYTRVSSIAEDNHETFGEADRAIDELPVGTDAVRGNAEQQVEQAVREQHLAYWRKDTERYLQLAGVDLLRVAENGISNRGQLVQGMRGNARLPAPPSEQLDLRVRVFGNTAIASWLDQGGDLLGRFAQGRFTVVLARRGDGWQMVHIQTSGVKQPPVESPTH